MRSKHLPVWGTCVATAFAAFALLGADQHLPLEPQHNAGQGIIAAFEGWYPNADGTKTILLGYYNRSLKESMDIPIGPNNRVEPGGPDRGQPTHFLPGRQWGVFTITVPKDFPPDQKITWSIDANGQPTSIPVNLNPLYVIAPFLDATGNTPPFLGFQESGPFIQGPPRSIVNSLKTTVGSPLPMTVWVADDAKVPVEATGGGLGAMLTKLSAVTVTWLKFRGPGDVKFDAAKPKMEKTEFKAPQGTTYTAKATTNATFNQPGEYILEVVANDWSGEGGRGFQCCWTTGQVKVSVTGGAAPTSGQQ